MKAGFTGTQTGMTTEQHRAFIAWFKTAGVTEFHSGCCIGADDDATDVAMSRDLGFARPRVVVHPPRDRSKASATAEMFADEVRPAKYYLDRNKVIVEETDVLAACPKGAEELRSGTWSTIRYARKLGRPITIFWPDGSVTEENTK